MSEDYQQEMSQSNLYFPKISTSSFVDLISLSVAFVFGLKRLRDIYC